MLPEIIRYKIPIDRKTAFEADYRRALKILDNNPHCLGWQFRVSTTDPENYQIEIRWDSETGHLDGFRKSPDFPPFLKLVTPYFGNIMEMTYYQDCTVSG